MSNAMLPRCAWPGCGRGTRAEEPASDGRLYCHRHAPPCVDCAAVGKAKPSYREEDDRIGRPLCERHWGEALAIWRKAARAAGLCEWCGDSREGSPSVRYCVSCAARTSESKARYYRGVVKPRIERQREAGREAAADVLRLKRPGYADVERAVRAALPFDCRQYNRSRQPVTPATALAACRRALREASPEDRSRMAPKLVRWLARGHRTG